MKKLFLLLFVGLFMISMASMVIAEESVWAVDMTSNAEATFNGGMRFSPQIQQIVLKNVTLDDQVNETTVCIRETSLGVDIACSNVTNFVAPFDLLLNNNSQYWAVSLIPGHISYNSGVAYPRTDNGVLWDRGYNPTTNTEDTLNGGYNILSIGFELYVPPVQNWTDSLNDNLQYYYTVNETSGTSAYESFQYNNLTGLVGDWKEGIISNAYSPSLDTVNSTFQLETLAPTNEFSVSFWVNRTDALTSAKCFSNADSGGVSTNGEWEIYCDGTVLGTFVRDAGGTKFFPTDLTLTLNTWYHIVYVLGPNNVSLYVDGVYNTGMSITGFDASLWGGDVYFFSKISGGASRIGADSAVLDEIAFFNKTLNQSEVTQLYNNGNGITYIPTFVPSAPYFVSVPANETLTNAQSLEVQFVGADIDGDFDSYAVNSTDFTINNTGDLVNSTALSVGTTVLTITINDTGGLTASTPWELIVTQAEPTDNPMTQICTQSDNTWQDATNIAGLLFALVLIGVALFVLTMTFSGLIDSDKVFGAMKIENLPGFIIIIGLTFLVIATMSFLIAGNVCVAYGG